MTVVEYIDMFMPDVQNKLQEVRQTIKSAIPAAEECISYGIPTYKLNGKNLVHFGGFKNHIGFYPTPRGLQEFEKELSAYKGSKGAVQFPLDKAIPLDLIKRITLYRVEANKSKQKKAVKKSTK